MNGYRENGKGELLLTICLFDDSIVVNQDVLEVLGWPRQMQMRINEAEKKLLLQACTIDAKDAIVIPPNPMPTFEMSGMSLIKRIRRLTGWTDNNDRAMLGDYLPSHRVIVFDLNYAQAVPYRVPVDRRCPTQH